MPRVWGRLVSASLSDSVKLSRCTERNALIYGVMTLPKHDGQGRLEVDDVSMLSMCGRFGIVHRWTLEDMAAARDEFIRAGLWRTYETIDGRLCAVVVGWEKQQRLDRINRSSDLISESGVPSGVPSGGEWGENGGREGGDVLDEGGRKGQGKGREGKRSQDKKRGGSAGARVRALSTPNAPIVEKNPEEKPRASFEASGSRKQEIAMIADDVIRAFRAAHPLGDGAIIREHFDRPALYAAAHVLSEMKDRVGFFRRALATLPPHRLYLEAALEKLNDPTVVAAPSRRSVGVNPILEERAASLGITIDELVKRYEAGDLTALPVFTDRARILSKGNSGFTRAGEIAANGIMDFSIEGNGHPPRERNA